MLVGTLIKLERNKQNIKQAYLAKGICSISYLSKIENNTIKPSDEVMGLIFQKLNINMRNYSAEEETQVINSLCGIYKEGVLKRNKVKILECIEKFPILNTIIQEKNYPSYILYLFRLYLILEKKPNDLKEILSLIRTMECSLLGKELYLWNLNIGLYYYLEKNYKEALTFMEKSLKVSNKISIEDWERADLYNSLSICYLSNQSLSNAMFYAYKALDYYKSVLLLERAIDCYIVLGIVEKRLQNFEKSEKKFVLAQKIALDLKLFNYQAIILQNLGALTSVNGEIEKSIEYYVKSLSFKKEGTHSYFITLLSLIKEYSKKEEHDKVVQLSQKGLLLLTTQEELSSFKVHFELYNALHSSNDKPSLIIEKAIKYFENIGDTRHILKYSILLADYYNKNKKYKLSTFYFIKAKEIILKDKSIKFWQDL